MAVGRTKLGSSLSYIHPLSTEVHAVSLCVDEFRSDRMDDVQKNASMTRRCHPEDRNGGELSWPLEVHPQKYMD